MHRHHDLHHDLQVQNERETQNADETQQWGGETKFYKRQANELDSSSEFQFFRMC